MKNVFQLSFTALSICLTTCSSCQDKGNHPSALQFPAGYPTAETTPVQQLSSYPVPRYAPGNHLLRLFNWMDPGYLGMWDKPGVDGKQAQLSSYLVQKELITNWNYGIVLANSGCVFEGKRYFPGPPLEIKLANEYPDVSLDVITFWQEIIPLNAGYKGKYCRIGDPAYVGPYSIPFVRDGQQCSEIKFTFPDSFIHVDGDVQKFYLSKIQRSVNRPINRINENGEEPPGAYIFKYIQNDPQMIRMKDSMKIDSWEDFASICKLHMRNVYSSAFMQGIPQLKNTLFSFYTDEGGPIDRFKWPIMKKCMTPINGTYYSTPDFYPRWPYNWKDWTHAWHGWKWIEIGRKVEIADGDYLFSPFVAAGWSKKNEENITPGQWLGLLKSLSVIGAEFYYVGYFNLGAPFANPADYVWQAAMPAYAQAITSRFEDVLRNGNVLFDNEHHPIVTYHTDDKHVLITARKQNNREKYVICGTYQPFSNDSDEIAEKKNVSISINGHNLSFEVRRQGSVYIYETTPDNRTIFYQLDKWHENKHPGRWSKDFNFEAEVADSGIGDGGIYTEATGSAGDYTSFTSYINLSANKAYEYNFDVRDSINQSRCLWLRYKGNGTLGLTLSNGKSKVTVQSHLPNTDKWKWEKIILPETYAYYGNNILKIVSSKGEISLDKFIITTQKVHPNTDL